MGKKVNLLTCGKSRGKKKKKPGNVVLSFKVPDSVNNTGYQIWKAYTAHTFWYCRDNCTFPNMQQLKFPETGENNTSNLGTTHEVWWACANCTPGLFSPAWFLISPSCYFTFHKVTSRRSYMLLGCFQEKKKNPLGLSKAQWPSLYLPVEQKLLDIFGSNFSHHNSYLYLYIA